MEKNENLLVAGTGSPVSLKKFIANTPDLGELTVLVDNTGLGIAKDEEGMVYITPEECKTQTLHYVKNVFDGRRVPAYLFRYINYIMFDEKMKWATDQDVAQAFISKQLTEESEEYVRVRNFLTYAEHNTEALQLIGFIQLVAGTLNIARKQGTGVRLFIEHPETGLHPKRERFIMSLLKKLSEEYGYKELVQPEHDLDGD